MPSPKNAVKLLRKQIEKLEKDDFDLDAWKGGTQSILERLFGADTDKVKQLQQIKIDYSSWALRDSTSGYNPKESVKHLGKELLESAIDEIEMIGLPHINQENDSPIIDVLSEFLDDKTTKSIIAILKGDQPKAKKRGKLKTLLKKLPSEDKTALIIEFLLTNK